MALHACLLQVVDGEAWMLGQVCSCVSLVGLGGGTGDGLDAGPAGVAAVVAGVCCRLLWEGREGARRQATKVWGLRSRLAGLCSCSDAWVC